MKDPIPTASSYILIFLAFFSLTLSFLPLLYEFSLSIAVVVALVSILIRAGSGPGWKTKQSWKLRLIPLILLLPMTYGRFGRIYRRRPFTCNVARALRLSRIAIFLSAGLYLSLWLHSEYFYIRPLNEELEPLRNLIRSQGGP